jgi:hypothetical protein
LPTLAKSQFLGYFGLLAQGLNPSLNKISLSFGKKIYGQRMRMGYMGF